MGLLRALAEDLMSPGGRYAWLESMVRNIPGQFGMAVRGWLLPRHFRSAGPGTAIHPGARVLGPAMLTVGRNCHIGLDNVIQANGGVTLGDDVILGPDVKIWSVNHVFSRLDVRIWDQGYEHKETVIGTGVWIGADCFIMPGAHIGNHVVISAGSVVGGKDIEPYAIVAGNPARKIGTRQERLAPPAAPAP